MDNSPAHGALIIFIKNPLPGRCKTRLASEIGDEEALSVYLKLLDYTREVAKHVAARRYLYYDLRVDEQDAWSSDLFIKRKQADGDLGQKMFMAFKQVLGENDKAIIIGSDCPELTPHIIEEALDSLNTHDVCIGPSEDGGYYLLGFKKLKVEFFERIPWSQSKVYEETMDRVSSLGLSTYSLPRLYDLDNLSDLEKFPDFKASF